MGVDQGCVSGAEGDRATAGRSAEGGQRHRLDSTNWPEEFGTWKTAWRLFDEWNADGTWDLILTRLRASCIEVGEVSDQLWCIDGTVVRAARCASGGGKKTIRRNRLIMR